MPETPSSPLIAQHRPPKPSGGFPGRLQLVLDGLASVGGGDPHVEGGPCDCFWHTVRLAEDSYLLTKYAAQMKHALSRTAGHLDHPDQGTGQARQGGQPGHSVTTVRDRGQSGSCRRGGVLK